MPINPATDSYVSPDRDNVNVSPNLGDIILADEPNENPSSVTDNQSLTSSAIRNSIGAKLKRVASSNSQIVLTTKLGKAQKSKQIKKE